MGVKRRRPKYASCGNLDSSWSRRATHNSDCHISVFSQEYLEAGVNLWTFGLSALTMNIAVRTWIVVPSIYSLCWRVDTIQLGVKEEADDCNIWQWPTVVSLWFGIINN